MDLFANIFSIFETMFVAQVIGVLVLWIAMTGFSYYLLSRVLQSQAPFSYKTIFWWLLFVCAGALMSALLFCVIPNNYVAMCSLILNHFTCVIAVHALFLKITAYVYTQYQKKISLLWRYLFVGVLYLILACQAILLLVYCSEYVKACVLTGVDYIVRTAVLLYLILELKSCNMSMQSQNQNQKLYTYSEHEYQDYDGQI